MDSTGVRHGGRLTSRDERPITTRAPLRLKLWEGDDSFEEEGVAEDGHERLFEGEGVAGDVEPRGWLRGNDVPRRLPRNGPPKAITRLLSGKMDREIGRDRTWAKCWQKAGSLVLLSHVLFRTFKLTARASGWKEAERVRPIISGVGWKLRFWEGWLCSSGLAEVG